MFGFIGAIVVFGLMLMVVAAGFRASEKAVQNNNSTSGAGQRASGAPDGAKPAASI